MDVNFQTIARTIVMEYFNKHKDVTDEYEMTFADTYVVWFSKTLQNWKALVSTNVPDGVYYEVTHDGDADLTYLDVYKKHENVVIRDEDAQDTTGPEKERDFVPESIPPRPPPMGRYETPNPLIKREEEGVEKIGDFRVGDLRF